MTEQPNHEMDDMAEVAAAVRRLSEALIIRQLDGDMAQATIDALVGIAERVRTRAGSIQGRQLRTS